ncbi:MAG TPA: 5-formyltetrahydrofolate cyclo-ligase [Malonomonas sp.]
MPKHVIRQELLTRRKQLGVAEHRHLSQQAQRRLIESDCFKAARTLALYSAINNEVQTELLFAAAVAEGKRVSYPRVRSTVLEFVEVVSLPHLQLGSFGVAEPQRGELLPVTEIDLLVVPGVAFDRSGHRLGYGKGFYDRELARVSSAAVSVGLCFDFQLCGRLPSESHDQPVRFIATETQFIPCRPLGAGSP